MVKQLVPIFPARTQRPGVRVLLIVHSIHTSGTRNPGRMETNYVPNMSLLVPWQALCTLSTFLPESVGQKEPGKLRHQPGVVSDTFF